MSFCLIIIILIKRPSPFQKKKQKEIAKFSSLLALLASEKVNVFEDYKVRSIGHYGRFIVKSLSAHLISAPHHTHTWIKGYLKPFGSQAAHGE